MTSYTGSFLWYDLNTTDPVAAQAFYTQVLGWNVRVWDMGNGPYPMWLVGEDAIGGVMALAEEAKAMGAPPHWMSYIGVPDTATAVEKAVALGAKVFVPPMAIPTVGTFAVVADPQKAVFAFFTPADASMGCEERPGIGQVSWHELATEDVDAAWSFYTTFFGWNVLHDMDMGPPGTYRIFRQGEKWALGGIFKKPADMPMPSCWTYYFQVADLDATIAKAQSLGGTLVNGPMEVPDGDRVAVMQDPQGAVFGLHWMKNAVK